MADNYYAKIALVLTANGEKVFQEYLDKCSLILNYSDRFNDPKTGATAYYWDWMYYDGSSDDQQFLEAIVPELDEEDYYLLWIGERRGNKDEDWYCLIDPEGLKLHMKGHFSDNPFKPWPMFEIQWSYIPE